MVELQYLFKFDYSINNRYLRKYAKFLTNNKVGHTPTDSLSNGEVAVITAVICCVVCVMATAIITFVITAYYYKKNDKPIMITRPVVGKTDVVEYEEITKASSDNMAMTTNPSYDVAMTSNPAYGHNVKKID